MDEESQEQEKESFVISNGDMDEIIRTNQRSLEQSSLLINKVDIKVKHEITQQKGGFLGTLLRTLGIF